MDDLTELTRDELVRYGRKVYRWPDSKKRWAETHRINEEIMRREKEKKK